MFRCYSKDFSSVRYPHNMLIFPVNYSSRSTPLTLSPWRTCWVHDDRDVVSPFEVQHGAWLGHCQFQWRFAVVGIIQNSQLFYYGTWYPIELLPRTKISGVYPVALERIFFALQHWWILKCFFKTLRTTNPSFMMIFCQHTLDNTSMSFYFTYLPVGMRCDNSGFNAMSLREVSKGFRISIND